MRSTVLCAGGGALLCTLMLSACILAMPPAIPQPSGKGRESGNGIIAPAPAAKRARQLAFSPDTLVIAPNERKPLVGLLRDQEGIAPTQQIIWSSSDNTIASVNGRSGEVLGLGEGTALITATMENAPTIKAQLRLTVTTAPTAAPTPEPVPTPTPTVTLSPAPTADPTPDPTPTSMPTATPVDTSSASPASDTEAMAGPTS